MAKKTKAERIRSLYAKGHADFDHRMDMRKAYEGKCAACYFFSPWRIGDDGYILIGFCEEPQPNTQTEPNSLFAYPQTEHHWRCGKFKEHFKDWMFHELWLEKLD